jgi:TRAP-type C4-dicarboxylate transport system permease small subunit
MLLKLLHSLDRGLTGLMYAAIIISTAAIIGLITFLILSRFVFGWSVVGLLELSTLCAIWLYMTGAVLASRNKEHIVVDFTAQAISAPRLQALHELLVAVIVLVLGLFFLSLARDMLGWSFRRPQTTPGLGIPLLAGQSAIVFAAAAATLYALRDVVAGILKLFHPNREA